jgi:hypothetical protein
MRARVKLPLNVSGLSLEAFTPAVPSLEKDRMILSAAGLTLNR